MNWLFTRMRAGALLVVLASTFAAWSDSRAGAVVVYSIDFHAISPGATTMHNSCFVLSGTVGQVAPGYAATTSGAPTYSVYEGFWSAAAVAGLDEMFFSGFEGC